MDYTPENPPFPLSDAQLARLAALAVSVGAVLDALSPPPPPSRPPICCINFSKRGEADRDCEHVATLYRDDGHGATIAESESTGPNQLAALAQLLSGLLQ